MPDPLIASAFVRIKPEPKSVTAFGKDVRTAIEKSFTRPVRIKVEPTLLPFKKKIQTELSSAIFTVKVTPVLAPGFKSQVSKLAKTAAAGITIPVKPSVPVGATGKAGKPVATAARGPVASTAASREAVFQKRLADLALTRTIATQKLTDALAVQGTAEQRLAVVEKAESAASGVLQKHKEALIKIESSLTQKQVARLRAVIKLAQADLLAAAAAKAAVEGEITKAAALADANAQADLSAKLELRRLEVEEALVGVQNAGALSTTKLAAARAELSAASAAATAASALNKAALATEDIALKQLTADLVKRAVAEKVAREQAVLGAIANEEAAAAAAHRAKAEAQLQKGLLATALAAAGARGATLAASTEFLVGAASAVALFKSIQLAANLEESLNVFRVTAAATAEEMNNVSAAAKRLGADVTLPSVSANDAADAMTELAKAGLTVKDSIDAARGTLQLGTAAQLDNATAVNITASALNAFGLAGTQAVHVADLLAGAANAAQGGIGDMGQSLSSVASVARQAGVSVEDTVALLTLLAKNGIQGAEAGTALRVAIIRLIAPTAKAKEVFEKFNISVLDSQGNLRPQVFSDIAAALDEVGASERNAALQTIFGTRAIRAQAVIGREGAAGLNAMRDATNQQGAAARLAAARTEGFGGKIEALKNSASTLGLVIGESLIPTLSTLFENLNQVAGGAIDATEALKAMRGAIPGGLDITPGFDLGIFDPGIKGISARIKELRAINDLRKQGNIGRSFTDVASFQLPSEQAQKFAEEAAKATDDTDLLADALKNLGGASKGLGGPVGAQITFLEGLRKQITGTGEDAEAAREKIDATIRLLVALGRTPSALELKVLFEKGSVDDAMLSAERQINQARINIELGIAPKSKVFLGNSAKEAADVAALAAKERFATVFGTELADSPLGSAVWDPFFLNAKPAAEKAAGEAAASFSTKFSTFLAAQEASGASDAERLADLRGLLPGAERRFRRAQAQQKNAPTEAHEAFLAFASQRLNEINSEIETILGDQASAAKEGADKIAKARNEADQKFLDALGLGRGRIENRILLAEGRAGLDDDIKTHTDLRNFFKRKIEEASKTIKDAQTKAETIQSLTGDLIAENQKLRELNRQLIDSLGEKFEARLNIASIIGTVGSIRKIYAEWIDALQKALREATKGSKLAQELKLKILETQKSAFDAINEGFELDVQIAEAQERPRAEIKARERFIEQLRREQEQYRRGSLEWKRLQLEIIEQRKAIEEAGKELDKKKNADAEFGFKFLQTQSGFAANLLGNLIPGFATGGLVGGTGGGGGGGGGGGAAAAIARIQPGIDPLTGRPIRESGVPRGGFDGRGDPSKAVTAQSVTVAGGPTRGMQARELHLLTEILHQLRALNGRIGHPESKQSRVTAHTASDHLPT